jgi:hypothetical protein
VLDRDVGGLGAFEKLDGQSGFNLWKLEEAWSVTSKTACFRQFGPFIDGRQAQRCCPIHNKLTIGEEHR